MTKPNLNVIILNHNTKELLSDCLNSVKKYMNEVFMEVIVSDNSSTDGSVEMVKNKFPWVKLLEGPNISFSNGNNRARNIAKGKYILFLNSDTVIHKNVFAKTIGYLDEHKNVGALTCKLILANGKLDKDARRRFPTPWISFKRLFLRNSREYWYEEIPDTQTHEVDAIQGAFFLTKKNILDKLNWLDEEYLFDGEDLDLCFQIKKLGYKIIYYPEVTVTHHKRYTKDKISTVRLKRIMQGIDSMEYFYRKNLWGKYPLTINYLVLLGIKIIKLTRFFKTIF